MATTPVIPLSLSRAAQVFHLMADETRLRLLLALAEKGELPVKALCADLVLAQSTVSHHLALLRLGGLVAFRRQGQSSVYSLTSETVRELLRSVKY